MILISELKLILILWYGKSKVSGRYNFTDDIIKEKKLHYKNDFLNQTASLLIIIWKTFETNKPKSMLEPTCRKATTTKQEIHQREYPCRPSWLYVSKFLKNIRFLTFYDKATLDNALNMYDICKNDEWMNEWMNERIINQSTINHFFRLKNISKLFF